MASTKTIQAAAYTLLAADAALKVLTGADATDPRIYQSFGQKERTCTDTYPGYVVIYERASAEPYLDREGCDLMVSCFALSLNLCKDMADQVDTVLHRATLSATGWTDVSMTRTTQTAGFDSSRGTHQLDLVYEARVFAT